MKYKLTETQKEELKQIAKDNNITLTELKDRILIAYLEELV
jgi:hypothetical protein